VSTESYASLVEKKGVEEQRPVISHEGFNSFIKAGGGSPSASRPNPASGLDGEAQPEGCLSTFR